MGKRLTVQFSETHSDLIRAIAEVREQTCAETVRDAVALYAISVEHLLGGGKLRFEENEEAD